MIGEDRRSSAPNGGHEGEGRPEFAADSWKTLLTHLAEIREHVLYLASARIDAVRLAARKAALLAAIGVLGLAAAAAAIATSVVLLLRGLAQGAGTLFEGKSWLGDVSVGLALLILVGIGTLLVYRRRIKKSRSRTIDKYEQRKNQQRSRFGASVSDRARGPEGA